MVGSGADDLYDTSPHNLFPIVFEKLLAGETPRINGDDYDTPDGTCVRDYIHVSDLAAAHVVAAQRLSKRDELQPVYNLGSGTGCSVAEIMTAIRNVTEHRLHSRRRPAPPRRPRPHRCQRRGGGPRPGLEDAPRPRGHGPLGLAGPQPRRLNAPAMIG